MYCGTVRYSKTQFEMHIFEFISSSIHSLMDFDDVDYDLWWFFIFYKKLKKSFFRESQIFMILNSFLYEKIICKHSETSVCYVLKCFLRDWLKKFWKKSFLRGPGGSKLKYGVSTPKFPLKKSFSSGASFLPVIQ